MKTLAFRYDATQTYRCSEPGDQSGEYVKADVVRGLVEALREARGTLTIAIECGLHGFSPAEVKEIVANHSTIKNIRKALEAIE